MSITKEIVTTFFSSIRQVQKKIPKIKIINVKSTNLCFRHVYHHDPPKHAMYTVSSHSGNSAQITRLTAFRRAIWQRERTKKQMQRTSPPFRGLPPGVSNRQLRGISIKRRDENIVDRSGQVFRFIVVVMGLWYRVQRPERRNSFRPLSCVVLDTTSVNK